MTLQLQPVQVATGGLDSEGQLVFADNVLLAVLTRLSDLHEDDAGKWFLEALFRVDAFRVPAFATLEGAVMWLEQQRQGPS